MLSELYGVMGSGGDFSQSCENSTTRCFHRKSDRRKFHFRHAQHSALNFEKPLGFDGKNLIRKFPVLSKSIFSFQILKIEHSLSGTSDFFKVILGSFRS